MPPIKASAEAQPLVAREPLAQQGRGASTGAAVVSLVKICVGPGILALPLAFHDGGIGFSVAFLLLIGFWTRASVHWLLDCKQQLSHAGHPRDLEGDSTYVRIGRLALGNFGAILAEASIAGTLIGVCAVYLVTASDLLRDTWLSFRRIESLDESTARTCDVAAYSFVLLPLSLARNVGFLAPFSAAGVAAIAVAFAALVGLGLYGAVNSGVSADSFSYLLEWHSHWPRSVGAFSAYYGVAAFTMGLPLVALNVEESMQKPEKFPEALRRAIWLVWACFALCGSAMAVLFYGPAAAQASAEAGGTAVSRNGGNILDDLPQLPAVEPLVAALKGAVALCALLTYPLALVPIGQMAEKRVFGRSADPAEPQALAKEDQESAVGVGLPVAAVSAVTNGSVTAETVVETPRQEPQAWKRALVRLPVVAAAGGLAIAVPKLGTAVSLIGCCTMSVANYVLPPLFHLNLFGPLVPPHVARAEMAALIAGLLTVLLTTGITGWSVVVSFLFVGEDAADEAVGKVGG